MARSPEKLKVQVVCIPQDPSAEPSAIAAFTSENSITTVNRTASTLFAYFILYTSNQKIAFTLPYFAAKSKQFFHLAKINPVPAFLQQTLRPQSATIDGEPVLERMNRMSAKLEYKSGEIRVFFDGELDHHAASLLRVSIDNAVSQRRPKTLVLDFGGVSFMDSSGIGLVMGRFKLMQSIGGSIRVENLSPGAYKVMKLAGLDRLGELRQKEVI